MLTILSPARNVHPASPPGIAPRRPLFPKETAGIAQALRQLSPLQLETLMDVPPERVMDYFDLYQHTNFSLPGTPALASYHGAVYRNLDVPAFDAADWAFAQTHLRILSAFYGMLRPTDGILPHRLGLADAFCVAEQPDLYAYWGGRIHRALYEKGDLVVNLSSAEYVKLIKPYMIPGERMLTCRFLLQKPDGARGTVATVRIARGQMARFIVKERVDMPEGLKDFAWAGYRFIPGRSGPKEYVFIQRPEM
jgi:cytoplasmic iron level regulating protein YaaA (DUF328/UPF0246 family)